MHRAAGMPPSFPPTTVQPYLGNVTKLVPQPPNACPCALCGAFHLLGRERW